MARHVALRGKSLVLFGQSLFVPHQAHKVGGILTVVDGEGWIKTDGMGVAVQETGSHSMEGAGPPIRAEARFERSAPLIMRSARRERVSCRMRPGGGPVDNQVGNTVRQRVGLTRASPGDDQERARDIRAKAGNAVLDRAALLGIETLLPTKRFTYLQRFSERQRSL